MYTKEQLEQLHKKNVLINGKEWHLLKLAEECNELSASILQYITKETSELFIQKEAGDVEIALCHLREIYGSIEIDKAKDEKYQRIETKLLEQENTLI
jgi:hypothetical protein